MKIRLDYYQRYLLVILLTLTSLLVVGQNIFSPAPPAGKTWHLIFEDDFETGVIDYSKWKREVQQRPNSDNTIFTYWVPNAYRIENGILKIQTTYSGNNNANGYPIYYSGGLITKGKFTTGFSYMEARVKILQGNPGLNSAFWTMSEGVFNEDGSGQDGTEMDIIEMPWHTGRIQHALHWDGYGTDHKHSSKVLEASASLQPDAWVTIGLWWKPDEYIFYVNGEETWRTSADGVSQAHNAHLLLTSIVSSSWGGIIDKNKMPVDYEVDYVRVYALTEKDKFSPLPLRDPGFEKGVWEYTARKPVSAQFSYDTVDKMEGNQSLKCVVNTIDAINTWRINTSIALLLESNSEYEITFSAKTTGNAVKRLNSRLIYGGTEAPEKFNLLTQYTNFNLTNEWQNFKISFKTNDLSKVYDQTQINFDFIDVATYYLDDIKLTKKGNSSINAEIYQNQPALIIYPNPVNDMLYLSKSNNSNTKNSYKIYNSTGNIVKQGITQSNAIDCSSLMRGMYFITLNANGEINHGKFLFGLI